MPSKYLFRVARRGALGLLFGLGMAGSLEAAVLWSDPASRVIHNTPEGVDMLGGVVQRDDKASDALYFKLSVEPLSDAATEPYHAVFQLIGICFLDAPRFRENCFCVGFIVDVIFPLHERLTRIRFVGVASSRRLCRRPAARRKETVGNRASGEHLGVHLTGGRKHRLFIRRTGSGQSVRTFS